MQWVGHALACIDLLRNCQLLRYLGLLYNAKLGGLINFKKNAPWRAKKLGQQWLLASVRRHAEITCVPR